MALYAAELMLGLYLLTGWPTDLVSESELGGGGIQRRGSERVVAGAGSRKSGVRFRWLVIAILANDTICTIALCVDISIVIQRVGSDALVPHTSVSVLFTTVWVLTTYLASTLEQGYFLHRYWSISSNKIITSIIGFLISSNLIFVAVVDGMFVSTFHNPSKYEKVYATFVASTLEACTDISISLALVYKLRSIDSIRISTRKLLHKICLYVVAYGCVTATSSVLLLVTWMVNINGYMSIYYCTGRIYSLTVLCNFLFVAGWRAEAAGPSKHRRSNWSYPRSSRMKEYELDDIDFNLRLGITSSSVPEVATSFSTSFVPSSSTNRISSPSSSRSPIPANSR
ncbi:hypothetical protein GYMLUDRAFT_51539 [Collybiopsis luxurians FD-317 M1]|uniref:DUF6534 domain-containing protein n=1 Tax=Collybiopsis luxurians FD-317 M1 TaxID=944289 RepID=A0A0D0BJQ3_9AGAR|nr:hypothetical protein GYMLUDRAFT_51539 [Collybiopsis luxurians FD-317 M1]